MRSGVYSQLAAAQKERASEHLSLDRRLRAEDEGLSVSSLSRRLLIVKSYDIKPIIVDLVYILTPLLVALSFISPRGVGSVLFTVIARLTP